MSKYFDGEMLSGYEESPIAIPELETKLAEKDKISFAIEQLEKVKEIVKHFCEIHSDDYYGVKSQVMGIRQDVFEFIDHQINELKGENK